MADLDGSGVPIRLRPDRQHPTSQGFVCAKGTQFLAVAQHPERLLFPLRRQADGGYVRLNWPEALDHLAGRLRPLLARYGPDAIGLYFGNPLAFNTTGLLTMFGFMRALGTRQVFSASSQDCHNKLAGAQIVHGSPFIHPIPDVAHTDVALLLGTNPAVSQSSFVHLEGGSQVFDRLQQRGGRLIWVDPRCTESAQRWGEHVAIRPGTDILLLLTLLHLLRTRYRPEARVHGLETLLDLAAAYPPEVVAPLTGIAVERLLALAETLRTARRATFHMSVGVNQGPFGTLCYVTLQALACLTGHLDSVGGLLFHPLAVGLAELARRCGVGVQPMPAQGERFPSILGSAPAGLLAEKILTPGPEQIRALLVVAGDPLTSIPGETRLRQALRQLDCLVCVDMFRNATGREAHVLLPATSWLERWDLANTTALLQQTSLLQYARPIQPPPGETRPEAQILTELSLALGRPVFGRRCLARGWRWLQTAERGAMLATGLAWLAGLLGQAPWGFPAPRPRPGHYLGRGPRTPGNQVRFWHPDLAGEPARLAAYVATLAPGSAGATPPYTLLGRRRRLGHNGWLHSAVPDGSPEGVAWLAASDLVALGVSPGGTVCLRTAAASLTIPAMAAPGVMPGTVVVPHGVPELNVNALIPTGQAHLEPVSGQHIMTGVPVTVTAALEPRGEAVTLVHEGKVCGAREDSV